MISFVRDWERPLSDLDATHTYLAGQERCTGKVGVIGFCLGGGFVMTPAPGPRVLRGEREPRWPHRGDRASPARCLPDRRQVRRQGSLARDPRRARSLRARADRGGHRPRHQAVSRRGPPHLNDYHPSELPLSFRPIAKLAAASVP
jgi:Dienelactone hydrolase family